MSLRMKVIKDRKTPNGFEFKLLGLQDILPYHKIKIGHRREVPSSWPDLSLEKAELALAGKSSGTDQLTLAAAKHFGVPYDEVTRAQRDAMKAQYFHDLYGGNRTGYRFKEWKTYAKPGYDDGSIDLPP